VVYLVGFFSVVYVLCCLFLIFVVLIQKGEGSGLGTAFGGGGGDTAFGVKADTAWKKATAVAAALFIILSILLGILQSPRSVTESAAEPAEKTEAPAGDEEKGGEKGGALKAAPAEKTPAGKAPDKSK
jgi:preprotein translocase subunit SecG